MACARCEIEDFDHDMVFMLFQGDGKEYHKELGDCIKCQSKRIDQLEKQLKAVAELHLSMLEENTAQVGMIIKMLKKPGKLSEWLAKFGL
jgi:hypothetical protein